LEITPEVLKRVVNGDGLTDDDLDNAIEFFTVTESSLKLLGPTFHHAWYDVFCTLTRLTGFKSARDNRYPLESKSIINSKMGK